MVLQIRASDQVTPVQSSHADRELFDDWTSAPTIVVTRHAIGAGLLHIAIGLGPQLLQERRVQRNDITARWLLRRHVAAQVTALVGGQIGQATQRHAAVGAPI